MIEYELINQNNLLIFLIFFITSCHVFYFNPEVNRNIQLVLNTCKKQSIITFKDIYLSQNEAATFKTYKEHKPIISLFQQHFLIIANNLGSKFRDFRGSFYVKLKVF